MEQETAMVGRASAVSRINAILGSAGSPVQLKRLHRYSGATPHSPRPVLVLHHILEGGAEAPENLLRRLHDSIPGELLPDLGKGNSPLSQVVAQTAATILSGLSGETVEAGPLSEPDSGFWIESHAGLPIAAAAALALIAATGSSADLRSRCQRQLENVKKLCEQRNVNLTSLALRRAARARDVPCLQLGDHRSLWQFGWGTRSRRFWDSASNEDGVFGFQMSRNKAYAKSLFEALGLPTAPARALSSGDDPFAAVEAIGFPCVVKPLDRGGGKGVTANITNPAELSRAVALALSFSPRIMIEGHVDGADHRLLVVEGRLVAAARRDPPFVTGNGSSTVRSLIEDMNSERRAPENKGRNLAPITFDEALAAQLAQQSLTLDSVPAAGQRVQLRSNANRSTGASATDVLAAVHPDVQAMAELLAASAGLSAVGIDYMTPDVSRSPADAGGALLEINATPGIKVHLASGMSEDTIAALLLGDRPGRIPVRLLLCSTADAAHVAKLLKGKTLRKRGLAISASSWARIGSLSLQVEALHPVAAATAPLRHQSVEQAAMLWTFEEMQEHGLPVDRFESIMVLGGLPEEPWASLIRTASAVQIASDVEQAVRELLTENSP